MHLLTKFRSNLLWLQSLIITIITHAHLVCLCSLLSLCLMMMTDDRGCVTVCSFLWTDNVLYPGCLSLNSEIISAALLSVFFFVYFSFALTYPCSDGFLEPAWLNAIVFWNHVVLSVLIRHCFSFVLFIIG